MPEFSTRYRTATIDGLDVFYREAGDRSNPTLLLLHGFPSSSHMFRNLINSLSDRYHLVAPDHIGFGQSSIPSVTQFTYSFDNLADITEKLIGELGLDRFAIYIHDYGAPIGLRIATARPERITAIITQSGNAHLEGFTPFWDILFAHAKDRAANEDGVREYLTAPKTQWQYTHGVPQDRAGPHRRKPGFSIKPGWTEKATTPFSCSCSGTTSSISTLPEVPGVFPHPSSATVGRWGKNDQIFGAAGAEAYKRDLPNGEFHLLDAGHFALETHGDEISGYIRDFMDRL